MKIGIDIRTLMDARYSGVSEYALNLIKEILKLDNKNDYRLFYNCFGDCLNIPEFAGEKVKVVKYNYPNKILNYLFFKFFNYPKIDKALNVDVFFMPHINFIGLSGRAKSIITIHDLSFLKYPEFFSRRKNFWHKMINIKKLIKRFDRVVAVSENTKRDIVELCGVSPDKIKVIYSGIGSEFKRIDADEKKLAEVKDKYKLPEKFILYLGTLEPRKNVDGIIRAYNKSRSNHELRDYALVIAGGRGWKFDEIYKEWEQSEFKNDIKFLDYIDSKDKVYLYNLAGVFVYPSFYEGFGFPPLEAMASGAPVIISYAASLPEVAGEAALMVNPYNISDIALAIEKVLTDANLRNKLIGRGLEQVKKFSWENTAKEYLSGFAGSGEAREISSYE
ncbi:MAG: glycosyltransferase family 1 protein [Patescibacteria group bacterium]|nr:glycosyltransferase family 1 protein [Patescibacteria group bacterium]